MTRNATHKICVSVVDLAPDKMSAECAVGSAELVRTGSDSDWVLACDCKIAQLDTHLFLIRISLFARCDTRTATFRRTKERTFETQRQENVFGCCLVEAFA